MREFVYIDTIKHCFFKLIDMKETEYPLTDEDKYKIRLHSRYEDQERHVKLRLMHIVA